MNILDTTQTQAIELSDDALDIMTGGLFDTSPKSAGLYHIVCGYTGAAAGATLGSLAGPIGAAAGAMVGLLSGMVGSLIEISRNS